ncbi:urease accessory protein UreD [Halieaceae bacterium IMCC14734]|uniref:Urease accessory protein UreD n=1 Tax=Candidatus Litorirhabdus singularis TaxID=2518993 RepID=A0ABT3TJ89_9GAMM|nr:urease accessory protein UreD [Candidatus Litorirhabdus singularis]MCX2982275.1 urease accessory protein UreD [Candidatus Litorirhabdus singularis]
MRAESALDKIHQEHWHAELALKFTRTDRGSRLSSCHHVGPLYVQKPFYPEGPNWAHVYPLHPPGGLVSGDRLEISIHAGAASAALLTTPGAGRMYRARQGGDAQVQNVHIEVDTDAAVEWFPQESIVYDGARVELETTVNLAPGAHFGAWEITCFGLPASASRFNDGSFRQRYAVFLDGRPVFIEQLKLTAADLPLLDSKVGLQGQPVAGFFLIGPVTAPSTLTLDTLRAMIGAAGLQREAALGLNGDFVLGRYLGSSAAQARKLFTDWWQVLRPLVMQRPASVPRIWYT